MAEETLKLNFIPNDSSGGTVPFMAGNGDSFNDMTNLTSTGETLNLLTNSMGKLNDILSKVIDSFKVFNEHLDQNNSKYNTSNSNNSNNGFFNKKPLNDSSNMLISGYRSILQNAGMWDDIKNAEERTWMSGDINRKGISTARGIGSTFNTIGSIAMNPALLAATGGWSAAIGAASMAGGYISNSIANKKETNAEKADIYAEMLPTFSKLLASYGNSYLNQKDYFLGQTNENGFTTKRRSIYADDYSRDGQLSTAYTNDKLARQMFSTITGTYMVNSGLESSQFLNYMSSLGKYGVSDYQRAGNITSQAAKSARISNGSVDTMLDYIGTVERYGGNGIRAIQKASDFNTLKIESGQLDEILQGIKSSIEDGVSKGYSRNAEEMTDTLALLAQASGGSKFWTGKNGAARLQQMQSGLEGMGGMDSTESMIIYRAIDNTVMNSKDSGKGKYQNGYASYLGNNSYLDGGSYLNTIAAIEKGDIDKELLSNVFKGLGNTYGNDRESIVESLKKVFGLNTAGAIQLYNMKDNLDDSNITALFDKSELKDGETQKTNYMKDIKKEVVDIGSTLHKMWDNPEQNGAGSLSQFITGQSMQNVIDFWEHESTLPGMNGLNDTVLPLLYQEYMKPNPDINKVINMTQQYLKLDRGDRYAAMDPNYKQGVYSKIGTKKFDVFNGLNTELDEVEKSSAHNYGVIQASDNESLYSLLFGKASFTQAEENKFIEMVEKGAFKEELKDGKLYDAEIRAIAEAVKEAMIGGFRETVVVAQDY